MKLMLRHELKQAQLHLLNVFSRECAAQGLRYQLYYGSLLGVFRHNGMIPWDDDIDLVMQREDYQQLANIDWAKYNFRLISPSDASGSPHLRSKLSDNSTIVLN